MAAHCRGTELDLSWVSRVQVNHAAVLRRAEQIQARRSVKKEWQVWVLMSILSLHLTTHTSSLKATVLSFAQDASRLKGAQLPIAYFNNSYVMMMGWRKMTNKLRILPLWSGQTASDFGVSLFMSELNGTSPRHVYPASQAAFCGFCFSFKAINVCTWRVHCGGLRWENSPYYFFS